MSESVIDRHNPFAGAGHLVKGLRLIFEPGLRRFVMVPLLINIVLFAVAAYYAGQWFETFTGWFVAATPAWLDWLTWLLWPLFVIGMVLVVFYTFTLVANLIAAPFNGLLAEAVERRLRGAPPAEDGGLAAALRSVGPEVMAELRKLGYFVVRAVPLLLLFVVPVVNVVAPLLWLLFSAWSLAQEYMDAPMGNHGLLFPDQRPLLRERRLTVLGFGAAVMVATAIPVLNFLVVPAATAGATSLWVARFPRLDEA